MNRNIAVAAAVVPLVLAAGHHRALAVAGAVVVRESPYRAQPTVAAPAAKSAVGASTGGVIPDCDAAVVRVFRNCGFESGDFSGWITQDLTQPFFPLTVGGAGISPGFG